MTSIYIHGCSCGVQGILVTRVKNKYPDTEVFNTRVDRTKLIEQLDIQEKAGMGKSPLSIVVEDNGKVVTVLKEWKS